MTRKTAGGAPVDAGRRGSRDGGVPRSRFGAWILPAAAALGLIVALIADLRRGSGVDHTAGALLVVASTVLLLAGGLVLALWRRPPGWATILLLIACLIDILGTALAAWFLHEWALLGLMACAAVGWVLDLFIVRSTTRPEDAP